MKLTETVLNNFELVKIRISQKSLLYWLGPVILVVITAKVN